MNDEEYRFVSAQLTATTFLLEIVLAQIIGNDPQPEMLIERLLTVSRRTSDNMTEEQSDIARRVQESVQHTVERAAERAGVSI